MEYYHGPGRRGAYFEGWYLKHQGPEGELDLRGTLCHHPGDHCGPD